MIGGEGHLDSLLGGMKKVSAASNEIDGAKISLVAKAMVSYSEAMASGINSVGVGLVGNIANFASGIVKGLGSFFGIAKADPLGDLKKFAQIEITEKEVTQIKANAGALEAYAGAMTTMGSMTVTETLGTTLKNVMSGIGSLFGVGKDDPMANLKNFAGLNIDGEAIKADVQSLLGILEDPNIDVQKSTDFKTILENIAAGLKSFTGGTFIAALGGVATRVLNFLRGEESPIAEIMKLAEKSEELKTGAEAIGKIGEGLNLMGGLKFDGSDINIKEFARDLKESVPIIEAAIMGSEKFKLFGENIVIKGLASGDIKYAEATRNIRMLRKALGAEVAVPPTAGKVAPIIGEAALDRTAATAGGGGITSVNTGGNVVSAPTTNYVNNGIAARRPIYLTAPDALVF